MAEQCECPSRGSTTLSSRAIQNPAGFHREILAVEYVQSNALIINVNACIISFVFSVFVGIFFGLNPASRAAKLDPVIALSGE